MKLELGDDVFLCTCLLTTESIQHPVESYDKESCNYCGHYIVKAKVTPKILKAHKKVLKLGDRLEARKWEVFLKNGRSVKGVINEKKRSK